MDTYQTVSTIEELFKVRFLDDALRAFKRKIQAPWTLQKSSLRVFHDVLEYPVESGHDELAFFDNNKKQWSSKPNTRYTSIREFYEDPNNRNDLAEIWDGGTRFIGLRYEGDGQGSTLLNAAETASDWSVSGDATAVTKDSVFYKDGNASIRVSVTNNVNTATISASNTSISDSNYLRKYFFIWVYFAGVPTSVTLRFGNDATNYLYKSVTTQFSGQAFKAGQWNLLAMDLNAASTQGSISSSAFDYQAIILTGTTTGNYYIDASYLREWELLDYWYYSKYYVAPDAGTTATQEYFYGSDETYSTDDNLVGDSEWVDVIMYDALTLAFADKENSKVYSVIKERREDAWNDFFDIYPSLRPIITTSKYNFETDYTQNYGSQVIR